jgi:hypothetical protein
MYRVRSNAHREHSLGYLVVQRLVSLGAKVIRKVIYEKEM